MKIGAAYIRVSTDDQTELSPDSQLAEIIAYANRNDITIPDEYIFIEGQKAKGLSGRRASNRPEFQRMISLAKEKPRPFECVLLWKFSRFARNIDESTYYKSILRKKCGIDVISISEPIMEGMYGRLIEMIIEWSDEFYSINLANEVKRGMTQKAKKGEYSAYAPFGYKMKDKKLIIDEDQAEIVRWIYQTYAGGGKALQMAKQLNNQGIRTRFGNLLDNRFILYIVSNPIYKGYIVYSTEGRRPRFEIIDPERMIIQKGIHEPIVDEELWQHCYDRYISEKRLERRETKKKEYALRSLLKCDSCGATLTYAINGRLQCSKYNRGACMISHSIDAALAEKEVIAQIRIDVTTMFPRPAEDSENKNTKKMVMDLSSELNALNRKLQRLDDAYFNEAYTLDEYKRYRKELLKSINDINLKIQEQKQSEPKKIDIQKILKILDNYDKANQEERNRYLISILEKVIAIKTEHGYIFEVHYR